MAEEVKPAAQPETSAISEEALRKAEEFIEADEGAINRLSGLAGQTVTAIAVVMSLFHLYAAVAGAWPFADFPIISTQPLRYAHVAFVLILSFLLFPMAARFRNRIRWFDVVLGVAGAAILVYAIEGGEDFTDRATSPNQIDVVLGVTFMVLLLEATRRTTGWIVPVVALAFLAYAYFGPYLPQPWTHRGFDIGQIVGQLFITLEGIFGIPVDVSSSLIVLFCIYGAFLQHSGAGKFFIDFSLALMGNKANSAGRTVVLSSFLLGGPSGSGVATTVTIGAVAYPMMAKAGFEKNAAGGLLAAGGLGAIISPPVLGAAAFLIAEFLKISYLDVIWMALIPTCLYYLSLLFMVELDAKRFGAQMVSVKPEMGLWEMTRRYGFHFASLISIIFFMLWGFSPTLSVFWSTVLTFALSFLTRETALVPKKLTRALSEGSTSALTAATTCATAGIIVGVVTLTGLGLKFSAIVIDYAGGSLLLTALYTALIVWIVGLAVPVTASYIICAVIAAPAMIKLGVPDIAAHMFIFYYSVLVGSLPADRAVAVRRGRDHRRRSLQDHAAGLEVHAAGLPGSLRLRARPAGCRPAADSPEGRLVGGYRADFRQGGARPRGARRGGAGMGVAQDHHGRARAARGRRSVPRVPEPPGGADRAHYRPRYQLHRDNWRGHRRRRLAKTTHPAGPAQCAGLREEYLMDRRQFLTSGASLVAGATLLNSSAFAQQTTIAIATGGTGGVYYPLGGGMANVLTKYVPGFAATARVTGGSVDNLKLIGSQQSEVALVMVDAALDALKGEDKFKGNPVEVRTLMVLYPNRMHVVSIEGRGIEKMSDLKGKRVSTGSPGSATEVMAFRVIEAAGLDKDKDMRRERLGVAESTNAIKDGKIDAYFWVGGLPTAAVTDLAASPGIKIKLIDHTDVVDGMNKKYGNLYTTGMIPAKTYPGQDKDNAISVVQNILVANAKMTDKVAYDIVKTFIEKRDELVAVHGEAKAIALENQLQKNSPIPWHPGAVKYLNEKGVKM